MKTKIDDIFIETVNGLMPLSDLKNSDWKEILYISDEVDNSVFEKRIVSAFIMWIHQYNFMHEENIDKDKHKLN